MMKKSKNIPKRYKMKLITKIKLWLIQREIRNEINYIKRQLSYIEE